MSRTSRLRRDYPQLRTSTLPADQLGPWRGILNSGKPLDGENQAPSDTFEKHYSINEISQLWGLSRRTIRRIFEQEPGIIELTNHKSRHKRAYVTRRVPESVLRRVHHKLQKTA